MLHQNEGSDSIGDSLSKLRSAAEQGTSVRLRDGSDPVRKHCTNTPAAKERTRPRPSQKAPHTAPAGEHDGPIGVVEDEDHSMAFVILCSQPETCAVRYTNA